MAVCIGADVVANIGVKVSNCDNWSRQPVYVSREHEIGSWTANYLNPTSPQPLFRNGVCCRWHQPFCMLLWRAGYASLACIGILVCPSVSLLSGFGSQPVSLPSPHCEGMISRLGSTLYLDLDARSVIFLVLLNISFYLSWNLQDRVTPWVEWSSTGSQGPASNQSSAWNESGHQQCKHSAICRGGDSPLSSSVRLGNEWGGYRRTTCFRWLILS